MLSRELGLSFIMSELCEDPRVESVVQKYSEITQKVNMSLDEAIDLSKGLALLINRESNYKADYIVGIANGALLPTHVIATELDVPFEYIRMRRQGSRWKRRAAKVPGLRALFSFMFKAQSFARLVAPLIDSVNKLESEESEKNEARHRNRSILLIDDAIESGQSIAAAVELLKQQGAKSVKVAVLSWSERLDSEQKYGVVPDYVLNRRLQHYPWSENNPEVHVYRKWLGENGLKEWD